MCFPIVICMKSSVYAAGFLSESVQTSAIVFCLHKTVQYVSLLQTFYGKGIKAEESDCPVATGHTIMYPMK